MNLILASSNQHKAEEFNELFVNSAISIVPAEKKLEVEENGSSFFENALLKAKAYYDLFQSPVLADDSGLTVNSLPNELGIYSARFGGAGLSDHDRAIKLLDLLKINEANDRSAFFTCVLCFYLNPNEIYYFEGRMNGFIGTEYKSQKGFGYDPVFIPEDFKPNPMNLTVSELIEWKNLNSHRAIACNLAKKFFREKTLPNFP